jgi:outer membrane protein TolC
MILSFLFAIVAFVGQKPEVPSNGKSSQHLLADLELFQQKSLLLQAEHSQLKASKTQSLSRLSQIAPSISAGVGKSESRISSDLTGKTKSIFDYWRISADWNLFRGFSDFQAYRAAKENETAQEYQVRARALEIELAGAKVIFNRLYLLDAGRAQAELLQLKQETMRIGRDRYAQGKIPQQDLTKLEVDLAQQANQARSAELELAQNQIAWKAFFVDELKTNDWPLEETQSLALTEGGGSFASRRLRERASAAEHSWMSARLRHSPSLDFSLSYKELPLKSPNTGTWSGVLELSLPLFSRFETAAAAGQAHAAFLNADAEATNAEREEALRREYLKKKIKLSYENIKEARLIQEKAERLYRDMLRSFQLGRLSTNELFQEQDRRIRSVLSYSQARLAFHESLIEACALWGLSAKECLRATN